MAEHHYFRVCFVVQPGGSRKTEYYVLGTLDEVKQAVQADLASPEGAYHAIFYGEDILLQCWHDGTKVAEIDLHPFITYRVEGLPSPLVFPALGDEPALDMGELESDEPMTRMIDGEAAVEVEVDWSRVELPKLAGEPLPPGHEATFEDGHRWAYGLHDDWDRYL